MNGHLSRRGLGPRHIRCHSNRNPPGISWHASPPGMALLSSWLKTACALRQQYAGCFPLQVSRTPTAGPQPWLCVSRPWSQIPPGGAQGPHILHTGSAGGNKALSCQCFYLVKHCQISIYIINEVDVVLLHDTGPRQAAAQNHTPSGIRKPAMSKKWQGRDSTSIPPPGGGHSARSLAGQSMSQVRSVTRTSAYMAQLSSSGRGSGAFRPPLSS